MKIKTVCAESVLFGKEAFSDLGEVVVVADKDISPEHLSSADALIIRSKTDVNERMLKGTHVSFVGTATAGYDHIDTAYLNRNRIAWASAPGCNATSVRDYVVSALLCLANRHHLLLDGLTMAVIGVGQVGSRVALAAEALGMNVRLNDPPLFAQTKSPKYEPLDDVLKSADVVTLHVPLTREGPHATYHMADCRFFSRVKPGCIFINAARGDVVDTGSLLHAMESDVISQAVLDVWENEPYVEQDVVKQMDLATPHIAGYSIDGKLAGTVAVYREACHFFEKEALWEPPALPEPAEKEICLDARGHHDEELLWQIVRRIYDIEQDDYAFRSGLDGDRNARAAHFVRQRINYPIRREFAGLAATIDHADPALEDKVSKLGFG